MSTNFEIKREFSCSSDRVKCIDLHPSEPLLIQSLYTGFVQLWNYKSNKLEKTFEVTESNSIPVRAVKFVSRKQWFVCGSDDMFLRVYNFNTMQKIKQWEAHYDYIRCLAVHPKLPLLLSAGDDTNIKAWNWEKDFGLESTFCGHSHYVMKLAFDPRDASIFASASLDGSVKVWSVGSKDARFTLSGHEKGVNCLGFLVSGEKTFLASGGDDWNVKVWDYVSKQCVATLSGHTANVSAVAAHPFLPLIFSASEDGTVRIWNSRTFRHEATLDYGLDRAWELTSLARSAQFAIGFDFGTVMFRAGDERPHASMDAAGNVVRFGNFALIHSNVRKLNTVARDGDPLDLVETDLGDCEVHPKLIAHSPNGRLVCVLGENKFTLSTARNLKSVSFGDASEFVWSYDSKVFAVRLDRSEIKIFFENKERRTLKTNFSVEKIFGGALLAASSADFVEFFDWASLKAVARADFAPLEIFWSQSGTRVALVGEKATRVFGFRSGEETALFSGETEIRERICSARFIGDFCLVFVTESNCLKAHVGDGVHKGETNLIVQLKSLSVLLGYLPKENKVYIIQKDNRIVSVAVCLQQLALMADVIRGDLSSAKKRAEKIPSTHLSETAKFLQKRNLPEFALELATDKNQIFDLALVTGKLEMAEKVATELNCSSNWQKLAEEATKSAEFDIASRSATKSNDLGLLLLIFVTLGDKEKLKGLAVLSRSVSAFNVEFMCYVYLNETSKAIELLMEQEKFPEAALMARSYCTRDLENIVEKWNKWGDSNFKYSLPIIETEKKVNSSENGIVGSATEKDSQVPNELKGSKE